MPPVANTFMPAMAAMRMVEATVVAPIIFRATTKGKSRTDTLAICGPSAAKRCNT